MTPMRAEAKAVAISVVEPCMSRAGSNTNMKGMMKATMPSFMAVTPVFIALVSAMAAPAKAAPAAKAEPAAAKTESAESADAAPAAEEKGE